MQPYRTMGPPGLDAYLARYGAAPSPALDAICAQKDAHTALLYWFTDLDAAIEAARRSRRPILSLRLLGRLDEELSCANSRFFRKSLYVVPAINRRLRGRFVLHWQSVRPVPRVTIDFGDGRTIAKTLTGNSAHLVLDPDGHPVDALPGLFSAEVFADLLERSLVLAAAERRHLPALHRRELERGTPVPRPPPSRAFAASAIAPTKHVVEQPLLRNLMMDVDADTAQNLELHARVHGQFARSTRMTADGLVDWIYRELFAMPPDDPSLGLDVPDPFTTAGSSP